jgi:hypothetical protein
MPGESVEVPHPFIREEYSASDGDGKYSNYIGWRPGVKSEFLRSGSEDRRADGIGAQILTLVGRYRPGEFPERVFYTRKWRDPEGRVFGKNKLHTKTVGNFNTLVRGYRGYFYVQRREPQLTGQPCLEVTA